MSYSGTTAASSLSNPPIKIASSLGGGLNTTSTGGTGGNLWLYMSSHSSTQLTDSNFFTDANAIGMKTGDLVIFSGSTGSSVAVGIGVLGAVSTDGAALASTGGIVSSTR